MTRAPMRNAVTRISLVLFLTVAMSYQSWSITVPADPNYFFSPAPPDAGKILPSLIDIDDEYRAARASTCALPAVSFACAFSILLDRRHEGFDLGAPVDKRPIQRLHVVLLI